MLLGHSYWRHTVLFPKQLRFLELPSWKRVPIDDLRGQNLLLIFDPTHTHFSGLCLSFLLMKRGGFVKKRQISPQLDFNLIFWRAVLSQDIIRIFSVFGKRKNDISMVYSLWDNCSQNDIISPLVKCCDIVCECEITSFWEQFSHKMYAIEMSLFIFPNTVNIPIISCKRTALQNVIVFLSDHIYNMVFEKFTCKYK